MIEERVNINGEFLGISSLAIYSAPWFLQIVLLMLVVAMFIAKVSRDSRNLKKLSESSAGDEQCCLVGAGHGDCIAFLLNPSGRLY